MIVRRYRYWSGHATMRAIHGHEKTALAGSPFLPVLPFVVTCIVLLPRSGRQYSPRGWETKQGVLRLGEESASSTDRHWSGARESRMVTIWS